ncbi:PA4642 family protein [Hahella sp. HN01]|uniref:PA4642 family protein n=1 Tax=Hahella sp. HN01 TaxID=2847262 RepID=UPI001C1F0F74|nr:PA4642 family protein [Hahella sp. HN01]MBU6950211.1 PA4642 family protein [Hahella sp. HN01]
MSGPSQPKVVDEEWSDERVQGFLELEPRDESDPDYHVLRQAYEYMLARDYARFVAYFAEADRNINALSPEGETMLDRVDEHARGAEYAQILRDAGGKKAAEL